jgi:hypothetical protein
VKDLVIHLIAMFVVGVIGVATGALAAAAAMR